jgi:C1A family cysteine protease
MYTAYEKVLIPQTGDTFCTGWLPPFPDLRDYSVDHPVIVPMAKKLGLPRSSKRGPSLPAKVDLRKWCSPVEKQGCLGACSAHAGVGLVEYFERRAFGKHIDRSRLFLYKTTRNLMRVTGDTGAWLRNAMGALVLCGVPPENLWPYTDDFPDFDKEPPAFVYSVADNYETAAYFRHDASGKGGSPADTLASVKTYLAAGIPSMFGFFGFPSFHNADVKGGIPMPCEGEQAIWGHAVDAVGYDDKIKIANKSVNKGATGAFLVRNSWGTDWGDDGYGWLPYEYVLCKLADDFWSLLSMNWIDTRQFGF